MQPLLKLLELYPQMKQSKIVISNAELKAALRKLGKQISTGRYRRRLVNDLKVVKKFGNDLIEKAKENV
jgi:hypothetical protein